MQFYQPFYLFKIYSDSIQRIVGRNLSYIKKVNQDHQLFIQRHEIKTLQIIHSQQTKRSKSFAILNFSTLSYSSSTIIGKKVRGKENYLHKFKLHGNGCLQNYT